MHTALRSTAGAIVLALLLAACGEGDRPGPAGIGEGAAPCAGNCATDLAAAAARLSVAEVETVLAQAVNEAQAQGVAATIAVVDRVGNVLAVYRMDGASPDMRVDSLRPEDVNTGLENLTVPSALGAISKAVTGAYLSSEGNAFSTRTAGQIVQEHFNPGELNQVSGPLFGVQFSQLACSDLVRREADARVGPKRSPLGLAADPGGLPLYKNGTPVGGVGVMADGIYGLDLVLTDSDRDLDELIAVAASFGFAAPRDRRGDRITVEGKTFRFSDVDFGDTLTAGAAAPALAGLNGELLSIPGYTENAGGAVRAGVAFGRAPSGYRPSSDPRFAGLEAFELIEADGSRRYPPRDAADNPAGAEPLSEAEVAVLLRNALRVARQGRAQIRRPLGSQIHVTASVVDSRGAVLGVLRTHDGPIFGTDVSLQKARTAVFFSSDDAGQRLSDGGAVSYLDIARDNNGDLAIDRRAPALAFADYVQRTRDLFGPTALTGTHAFADRSGGNLSRPFFPDGLLSAPPGPFSKPFADWSPFSTGLQLDMVYERIIQHVAFTLGLVPDVSDSGCTGGFPAGTDAAPLFFGTTIPEGLDNGLQIFPGSVPIYRGGVLVGGIGISGDGVDQDDMIAFLGTHNAGLELGGALGNAPPEIRADRLEARGVRLRYVQCPQAPGAPNPPPDVAGPRFPETPFPGSDQQRVCEGL